MDSCQPAAGVRLFRLSLCLRKHVEVGQQRDVEGAVGLPLASRLGTIGDIPVECVELGADLIGDSCDVASGVGHARSQALLRDLAQEVELDLICLSAVHCEYTLHVVGAVAQLACADIAISFPHYNRASAD